MLRHRAGPAELILYADTQRIGGGRLAVRNECHVRRALEAAQPGEDFVGVGMCREHFKVGAEKPWRFA
jgi:hypothetical protein